MLHRLLIFTHKFPLTIVGVIAWWILLLCIPSSIHAQGFEEDDKYFHEWEEEQPLLQFDTTIFYRAIQSAPDLYSLSTNYALPQINGQRRAESFYDEKSHVWGVNLRYGHFSLLRLLGAHENRLSPLSFDEDVSGGWGGIRSFLFEREEPLLPYYASVHYSNQNYRMRGRFSSFFKLKKGWVIYTALDVKTGRDGQIKGVFTNAVNAGIYLRKDYAPYLAPEHSLSALILLPYTMKGGRSSSSQEAFHLTQDNYYNPSWGYQNGKQRNARVRREMIPALIVNYQRPLTSSTSLKVTLGLEGGYQSKSDLGWYNARTPYPDSERYMPSYTLDPDSRQAWTSRNSHFTQIDWDALIQANRLSNGDAAYALEDRVEKMVKSQLSIRMRTDFSTRLNLQYGIHAEFQHQRFYKQMRDLLGAEYLLDIDQFLIGDDTFGNQLQNNLRSPNRKIRRGDRFGYDYAMNRSYIAGKVQIGYRISRFFVEALAEVGREKLQREGFYEKELFPKNGSYGKSPSLNFTPYIFKLRTGVVITPRSLLELQLMTSSTTPSIRDLFYQPLYNNRPVENPQTQKVHAFELTYKHTGRIVDLQVSAFTTLSFQGIETRRSFDDLSQKYSNLYTHDIGQATYGIEAASIFRFSYRWSLSLAGSWNQSKYIRDAKINILTDADNTPIDLNAKSHLKGCKRGGVPSLIAAAQIHYFAPHGWGLNISGCYISGRDISISMLRRSNRVMNALGNIPENKAKMLNQESLRDVFSLDFSLSKMFFIKHSRLYAMFSIKNLTDNQAPKSGYESNRLRRIYAGKEIFYKPYSSRYLYLNPRMIFVMLSYRF